VEYTGCQVHKGDRKSRSVNHSKVSGSRLSGTSVCPVQQFFRYCRFSGTASSQVQQVVKNSRVSDTRRSARERCQTKGCQVQPVVMYSTWSGTASCQEQQAVKLSRVPAGYLIRLSTKLSVAGSKYSRVSSATGCVRVYQCLRLRRMPSREGYVSRKRGCSRQYGVR
jgi:hypothetical protein